MRTRKGGVLSSKRGDRPRSTHQPKALRMQEQKCESGRSTEKRMKTQASRARHARPGLGRNADVMMRGMMRLVLAPESASARTTGGTSPATPPAAAATRQSAGKSEITGAGVSQNGRRATRWIAKEMRKVMQWQAKGRDASHARHESRLYATRSVSASGEPACQSRSNRARGTRCRSS